MTLNRIFICLLALIIFTVSTAAAQTIQGTFAIKNVQTGMLLRPLEASNKNATPIVSYQPTNWKCMTWDFKKAGDQTYYLQNLLTGKTFQPASKTPADGTALEQQPIEEGPAQQWEFIAAKNNAFMIRLKGTELYITPSEEGSINSKILLEKKKAGESQLWTIYEQHPTM